MLKRYSIHLFLLIMYLAPLAFAGDFLPDFTPTSSIGAAVNINSALVSGVVNLGDSAVINSIAIDNNNKIVAGGFINAGFNTNFILARFNNDGTLDTTFNPLGPQPGVVVTNAYDNKIPNGLNIGTPLSNGNQAINNIVIDNNNKIVAVGYVNDGTNNFFTVARYNSNGTLDTTFNPTGIGTNVPGVLITDIVGGNATATAVMIDSNNKIVVTGYSQITSGQSGADRTDIALVRYNNDGSLDTTLNPQGLISGRPGIVVTNVTGPLQTSITGQNNWAYAITLDNDNRILVGGAADITITVDNNTISESTGSLVIRYNPDGSMDRTFNTFGIQQGPPGSAITVVNNTDKVTSIKIDNNNKIVLMGYSTFATNDDGQGSDLFIIRYNEDASFDITLNPGALLAPFIPGIIVTDIPGHPLVGNSGFIDNNNNIVIGGYISNQLSNFEVDPTTVGRVDFLVVRYLPSGALDLTFNNLVTPGFIITTIPNNSAFVGYLPNAQGNSIVLDNNNNIVLGGFSTDGPEKDFTIARYTDAGILDVANFNPTGFISGQPGVVIIEATGGTNPYNTLGVTLTLAGMTDVINLPNIAVDSERAARISSFLVGFRRPIIEGPVDILKNDETPLLLSGTAHPHATVHLSLNGMPMFSFQASSEGSWITKIPPLEDGDYHIYATSIDPNSHLAFSSNSVNLRVKTQSSIPPAITTPTTNEYFDRKSINTIGTAEPNAPLLLFLNAKFIGQTRANAEGNWGYELNDLDDGKYALNVLAVDYEGHLSRNSPAVTFFVDNVPMQPKINTPLNNETVAENFITITGTAKPHVELAILLNDKDIGKVIADKEGKWKVKLTELHQEKYRLQVVAQGAKKIASDKVNFEVKLTPEIGSSSNTSTEEENTSANGIAVKGISAPDDNIKLLLNGDHVANVTPDSFGLWKHQLDFSSVPEGEHKVQYALLDKDKKLKVLVEKPIVIHKQSW